MKRSLWCRTIKASVVVVGVFLAGCAGRTAPTLPAANPAELNQTLAGFDQCRMLAMRAIKNAQDLKTVSLYGRGWGLDMPEAVAEDMLLEGMWLFDHLHAMDLTSMSLVSYAAAKAHPNLGQELAVFQAYVPEAAAKALAYHEKTSRALADGIARVNAAAEKKRPFEVRTISPRPWTDAPIQKAVGGGFRIGWVMPVVPAHGFEKFLAIHGHDREWMLARAAEAGVDFIRAYDPNTLDWADVETAPGRYDWTKVDEVCRLLKRHGLGIWLRVLSSHGGPPDWLVKKLGDEAVLVAPDGKRIEVRWPIEDAYLFGQRDKAPQKNPMNLFHPVVAEAFGRYLKALIRRVQDSGVPIVMVELRGGGHHSGSPPYYGGPKAEARFRAWLVKNKIDPRKRWGVDYGPDKARLPAKLVTVGVTEPAKKRMLVDVVRWREEDWIEYFRPQVAAVRAAAPDLPVCTTSAESGEHNESMTGRHNERFVRTLGLVPYGFSSENIWDNLRRAYSPTHFSVGLTHSGTGNAFSQYAFSGYAHDTLMLFSLPHVRGNNWGESLFYPDLRWEFTSLLGWRRFHERAQGMAPEMLNTRPAPQVAVLFSDTSGKYQSFIQDYVGGTYGFGFGPANYHKIDCIGFNRILDSVGLNHDFVTEDQARSGRLADYQMLIMPSVQALPADVAEKVRQFVRSGGIVIATSAPALVGEDMEPKPPGQLADVFGADFETFLGGSAVAESALVIPRRRGFGWGHNPHLRKFNSEGLRTVFCTFRPRKGAKVLETFSSSGKPATILNAFGKGKALVVGYPVGRESFLSDVYHQHYGNNWPDRPHGTMFQQRIFSWFEYVLGELRFRREVAVVEEMAPRSSSYDASYPEGTWPRSNQTYRDYYWLGAGAPREVEVALRARDGNPNTYLSVFNREGSYGLTPGAVELEASSKWLKVHLARKNVTHVYDVSLGCAVPFGRAGPAAVIQTMIEPSMGRMFAVANDGVVRLYAGRRKRGGLTDEQLRNAVAKLATGREPPGHVTIAADEVRAFLAERGGRGVTISCEHPTHLPAARRLAGALEKAFGTPVRITRNSPRVGYGSRGWGHRSGNTYAMLEEPDIVLGNRDDSHSVARYGAHTGMGGHTAPLPIMPTQTFPGPRRSVIVLTRAFARVWTPGRYPPDPKTPLVDEKPARPALVVGASDVAGLRAGVEELIKLVRQAGARN